MWGRNGSKKALDRKKKKNTSRTKQRPFQFEALEPRLLLSADVPLPIEDIQGVPGVLPAVVEKAAVTTDEAVRAGDDLNPALRTGPGNGTGAEGVQTEEPVSPAGSGPSEYPLDIPETSAAAAVGSAAGDAATAAAAPWEAESAEGRRELVIVDPSVAHGESLIDALKAERAADAAQLRSSDDPSGAASGPAESEWFIHVLDSGEDGIGQITEILKSYERLDAVHILSHGSQGEMSLGTVFRLTGNAAEQGGRDTRLGRVTEIRRRSPPVRLRIWHQARQASNSSSLWRLLPARMWRPRRTRRVLRSPAETGIWNIRRERSMRQRSLHPGTATTAT